MVRDPERGSKLSPKFVWSRRITQKLGGHKYEVIENLSNTDEIVHTDHFSKTSVQPEKLIDHVPSAEGTKTFNTARLTNGCASSLPHNYNFRHGKEIVVLRLLLSSFLAAELAHLKPDVLSAHLVVGNPSRGWSVGSVPTDCVGGNTQHTEYYSKEAAATLLQLEQNIP